MPKEKEYFTDELHEEVLVLEVMTEKETHPYRKAVLQRVIARLRLLFK